MNGIDVPKVEYNFRSQREVTVINEWRVVTAALCEIIHDLLGPFDGRDPGMNGPLDLETTGAAIRKAQAVLSEVE